MEFLSSLVNPWSVGPILITATAVYFVLRQIIGKRLGKATLCGGNGFTARMSPHSISPEMKANSAASSSSYSDSLPPSRRETLLRLKRDGIHWHAVSPEEIHRNILPMTANYMESPGRLYTPTGFTVDEVKSLGDFPDYAILSGVPLPSAYPEHDINKALPRPYRPFRWSYHQTMCMCCIHQLQS